MQNIKQRARDMFDKKFSQAYSSYDAIEGYEENITSDIKDFIDQIIDLTIAERDRDIVEMINELVTKNTKGNPFPTIAESVSKDIINLINNTKTDKQTEV